MMFAADAGRAADAKPRFASGTGSMPVRRLVGINGDATLADVDGPMGTGQPVNRQVNIGIAG